MKTLDTALLQVLEAYRSAVYAKDVDAFVALYDENVRVFDMWGIWSHSGIGAWRAVAAGWFDSLGSERVLVEFGDAQVNVAQDLAVVHVFVVYRAVSAKGANLRSMTNRMTLALKHAAGAWKIVHEHTSAPVDHETAKVILSKGV